MTKVVAVSMVKDEADIIVPVLRHMATQVDALIVADNMSTDGTRDLLNDLRYELPLTVIDDTEPGYYQSAKMTKLAHLAGEGGAEFVIPMDADEMWYSPFGQIAEVLTLPEHDHGDVFSAPLFDHVPSRVDPDDADPLTRIGWRRIEQGALPKMAARVHPDLVIEQGNHGAHHHPAPIEPLVNLPGLLVVRHFPYRSPEQFVHKAVNGAAAYRATDLPEDMGTHWRGYGRIVEEHGAPALVDVFHEWFWSEEPMQDDTLIFDPAPVGENGWHIECDSL